jgi:excisionase family DNA binding protein
MAKRLNLPKNTEAVKVSEKLAFVTPQQAAEQLECSEQVIRRMVRSGELQGAKVGGRFKIIQASIDAVLRRVLGHSSSESRTNQHAAA